jgi:hypothetical protein
VPGVEGAERGEVELGDGAGPIGRALDALVVVDDHDAVPRGVDVGFEDRRAQRQRAREGGQRVLGRLAAAAAVADHEARGRRTGGAWGTVSCAP